MKTLNYLRSLLVLTSILLFGNSQAQLVADFTSDVQLGCAALEVHFDETSSGGPTSFFWNFGDGSTSTLANPVHVYDTIGLYTVSLTIEGSGMTDSIVKLNYIEVEWAMPIAVDDSVQDATSCNSADGAIYLDVSGAAAPYNIEWSNGETTSDLTGLVTGIYGVTITSSTYFGCSWTQNFYVTHDTLNLISTTNNPTSCGSADGWINIAVNGGAGPYDFQWSNGSTSQSISSLEEGVYVLTIEDNTGCFLIETFNLVADTSLVSANATVIPVNCNGNSDGVVLLSGFGGVPIYEYGTTPSFTTRDSVFENLSAGWYTFYVEDSSGCLGEVDVLVEEPDPISIAENITHESCAGCNDGSIDITVSGGTPPYSYLWNNGNTTEDQFLLPAGMYWVTVTDANGCERIQTLTLIVDSISGCGFTVIDSIQNTSACNASNGSIGLIVFGGASPYTYSWSNGETVSFIDNLNQGQYFVTVTDTNLCSETYSYTIGTDVQSTTIFTVDNLCYVDEDGVVEFVSTGGIPPYHYYLNTGDSTISPNARIANLAAGTYSVTISSDNFNCTSFETFTITEPDPIQISGIVRNTSCGGCSDGQVDLIVQGGTPPYVSFSWSDGSTTQDLNNAVQGNYVVEVVDQNGCVSQETFFIDDSTSCVDCVWPGDADYDGVANNNDVLAIGVAYNISGPTRFNASLNWTPQPATDWSLALASGANLKHVDCDGNGLIDSSDMTAINLNYGHTHAKTETNGNKRVDPALYYEFPTDTVYAGQNLSVDILFGRDSLQVTQLYGMAFSVNFDTALVESGSISYSASNSWLGDLGTNLIDFDADQYSNSKLDIALSRIDHVSTSGWGRIGIINFTMKDDISGKGAISEILNLSFSGVKAIDNNENELNVFHETGSIVVTETGTSISENTQEGLFEIYPNPAGDIVYVKSIDAAIEQIRIYDLSGRMQLSKQIDINQGATYRLNLNNLSNGLYLMEVLGSKTTSTHRLMITR